MVSDLPQACKAVLAAPSITSVKAATFGVRTTGAPVQPILGAEPDNSLPATQQ
jgi:penicillin-insensitive murein endopeptidase